MGLELQQHLAVVSDQLSVEDAEVLLEWLIKHPAGQVDLGACTHLHTANLQVLAAAQARISAWPENPALSQWLQATLTTTRVG